MAIGGIAMIEKLMKLLVQEIPDELSVCVFQCRKAECKICDYKECKHYRRIRDGYDVSTKNDLQIHPEPVT